jgi:hypothetical protein
MRSSTLWIAACALAACGGSGGGDNGDVDAAIGTGDGDTTADAADIRPMDPTDPVEEVPAFTGVYSFGKLTTEDNSSLGGTGTWFTEATTEHRVFTTRVHYARYRDDMLLQDKNGGSQVWVYDQATTTVGAPIALPSDAVGRATIRGGMIYVGGLAKVYSYEIATGTWRMRALTGTGTCQRVAAGKTRLWALCTKPSDSNTHELFSMWANKSLSDVVPLGSSSPVPTEPFTWITAAPDEDVAYFGSKNPAAGCIGKATATALEPCAIAMQTLSNFTSTVYVKRGEITDNGANLYVSVFLSSNTSETELYEINMSTKHLEHLRSIDDNAFAVCPDHSVVYQDFTISERYAGGVATDVRLGAGGDYDMGCPLKPL